MTNVDAKDPWILIFLAAVCVSSVSVCLFVGEMLNAGGWRYDDNHGYSFILERKGKKGDSWLRSCKYESWLADEVGNSGALST